MIRSTFYFLILLLSTSIFAVDLSLINTDYWYNTSAPVKVDTRVTSSESSITVFFKLFGSRFDRYQLELSLQKNFEDEADIELSEFILDTLFISPEFVLGSLTFDKPKRDLLLIKMIKNAEIFYFPVQLKRGGFSFPAFYPLDRDGFPVVNQFVQESTVRFETHSKSDSTIYAYEYFENFNPADPPMGIVQKINPNLKVQSLIVANDMSFTSSNETFYFIQNDTLSNFGTTLYKGTGFFPEYRTIAELIEPLTYISRPSELTELVLSENPKVSFDQYWLRLFATEGAAKAAIRGYYSKVFSANRMFTDYKPGWKTDRGIIYIIFGKPTEVYRKNFMEVWRYEDGTIFEFRILSNLFAPNLYVLIRNEKYKEEWIARTKALRGGN